jgi:hypothetical protein
MYNIFIHPLTLLIIIFAFCFEAFPMTSYTIAKTGRKVQLDGFLLEWPKDSAKKIRSDSPWRWDATNTKEGLTGYFKAPASVGEDWTFSFLPQHLSPYSKMELSIATDSAQSFYRVSRPGNNLDSSITAEWIIPWKHIGIDSLGEYKVGITACNRRGDTLPALVFSGKAIADRAVSSWGDVYFKAVVLTMLLGVLFYVQKKVKKTTAHRNKKSKPEAPKPL